MLFFALGKAKGLAESQTVEPILNVTPPPDRDNLDSSDRPIFLGVQVSKFKKSLVRRNQIPSFDRGPKKKPTHRSQRRSKFL